MIEQHSTVFPAYNEEFMSATSPLNDPGVGTITPLHPANSADGTPAELKSAFTNISGDTLRGLNSMGGRSGFGPYTLLASWVFMKTPMSPDGRRSERY